MFRISKAGFTASIVLVLLLIPVISADGGVWMRRHYVEPDTGLTKDEWSMLAEEGQTALIDYNNGKERLSIAVAVKDSADAKEAVWIFPVPARPQDSNMNLNLDVPDFFGDDVVLKAKENVRKISYNLCDLLVVPMLRYLGPSTKRLMTGSSMATGAQMPPGNATRGVTVYQHAELYGITAELVSAESGEDLDGYLGARGFTLPQDAASLLDFYAGKEYSFVIGWLSNYSEFRESQQAAGKRLIAVSVTFPTSELYFPLKPTSLYGDRKIPVNIYVFGHVSPRVYEGISGGTDVTYYLNDKPKNEMQRRFTRISIDAYANRFSEDLWIQNSQPLGISVAEALYRNELVFFILLALMVSCAASLIAGNLVFYKQGVSQKTLALIGLANLLTVVAFIIVALWRLKGTKIGNIRKILFITVFVIAFLLLTGVIWALGSEPRQGYWDGYSDAATVSGILCSAQACTDDADCSTAHCDPHGICVDGHCTLGIR